MKKSILQRLFILTLMTLAPYFVKAVPCTPRFSSASSTGMFIITNFSVTGYTLSMTDASSAGGTGYENLYARDSVDFMQGYTYSADIAPGTSGYYYYYYYNRCNATTWIDFNNNDVFETSECVGYTTTSFSSSTSMSLTMPMTAAVGVHRMRVALIDATIGASGTGMNPCAGTGYTSGDVRDYKVKIVALPACSGAPDAGIARSTRSMACPSLSFTLIDSAYTLAAGTGFQWQRSTDGVTWSNMTGATNATYTTTETAAYYYRMKYTCTSSGAFDSSNSVFVDYYPVCYCTPSYLFASTSCSTYPFSIANFFLVGEASTAIRDSAACDGVSGYLDRHRLTCNLYRGSSYTSTLITTTGTSAYAMSDQLFIDFNDNGNFETSETVAGSASYTGTSSTSFAATAYNSISIPFGAATGNHRLRVVQVYASYVSYPSISSCPTGAYPYYYGETRDYTVNVVAPPACSGTVTAGSARSSVPIACPSLSFTLSDVGYTVASGLVIQWQRSTDSVTWSNITGATSTTYTTTETASYYYRMYIVCTSTSESDTSTKVYVPYLPYCYCTPSYMYASTSCGGYYPWALGKVFFDGESSTYIRDSNACTGSGYQMFLSYSCDLMRSVTYNPTVITSTGSLSSTYAMTNQIWIDFSDNGTFETSESVGGRVYYSGNPAVAYDTISIPTAAALGRHRMRVELLYAGYGYYCPSLDPCPTGSYPYYYGEVRDYMVNIVPLPACSGTPSAGTVSSSTGSACSSTSFTLSTTGYTHATGLNFQWQKSTDTVTWTNIAGATNTTLTTTTTGPTYYRIYVTCTSSGGSDTSYYVYVGYTSACYCTPSFMYASYSCASANYSIGSFDMIGVSSTSIHDAATCNGSGYLDRTSLHCDLMQGGTYIPTIVSNRVSVGSATLSNQIWIDFNNNGNFETSESVAGKFTYSGAPARAYDTIVLPLTAPTGVHRLRIVQNYQTYASYPSISPCPSGSYPYYYGEARDYIVNITPAPPCNSVSTLDAGTPRTSSFVTCPSRSFTLSDWGYTLASGLNFQWQKSTDSVTWSNITGATNTTLTTTQTGPTWYRIYIGCSASGATDTSVTVFVAWETVCYCTPSFLYAATSCFSYPWGIDTLTSYGDSGTAILDYIPCDGSGYQNRTDRQVTYMQTRSYSINEISSMATYTYAATSQIWIDFNNDGVFATSETIGGTATTASSMHINNIDTFTLNTAAATAAGAVGIHRMRIVWMYGAYGTYYPNIDPCPTGSYPYYYGEARDYRVRIIPLPPCTSTVEAGSAIADVRSTCPSYSTVNLGVTGTSIASGLTYQWQKSSSATGPWTTIAGATNPTYATTSLAPTYFRVMVYCTAAGGYDSSANVFIDYRSYCYCRPSYGLASATVSMGFGTMPFLLSGYGGTFIHDSTRANTITNYEDNTYMSVTLGAGSTDTAFIGTTFTSDSLEVQAWIDYNDNGTFSDSEIVGGASRFRSSRQFMINVPVWADPGAHRMRVLTHWSSGGVSYPHLDPCAAYYTVGDARDYTAVIRMTPCTGTPTAGATTATRTSGCSSVTARLALTGTSSRQFSYQWQSSIDGYSWSSMASDTLSYDSVTATNTTYYRCVVTCPTTGYSDTSTPVLINVYPLPSAISGSSFVCSGRTITLTNSTTGGHWYSSATSVATVDSNSGVVGGVASGTTTITYIMPAGCYVTATVFVDPTPGPISGDTAVCVYAHVPLTNATTGGTWTSSNTSIATIDASGNVYGVSPGSVVISYTIPTGCTGSSPIRTYRMTVNPLPSITGTLTMCNGGSISLTGVPGSGSWTSHTPTIATVNSAGTVTALTSGTAIIDYISTLGCARTTSITVNPVVVPTAAISATPGLVVCAGTSVTFNSSISNGGSTPTYVWSVNGTISGGAASYTYTPANGDVVSVLVLSSATCALPDTVRTSVTMTVNPTTPPTVSLSTGMGDTVCASTPVTLTATGTTAGTSPAYAWWVNSVPVSGTASSYTYTPRDGDVITVRMISSAPCLANDTAYGTITLTVSPYVTPSVLLTSSAASSTSCEGVTVNYVAHPTNGGTAPTYLWTVNGSYVGGGSTYSYVPANGDVVKVVMTSNFPCLSTTTDFDQTTMTVNPVTYPRGSVSVTPGYRVVTGSSAAFTCTITSGGGAYPHYQWTKNNVNIAGATNPTYTGVGGRDFATGDTICCRVTNSDQCSGTSTFDCIVMSVGAAGVDQVGNGTANVSVIPNPNKGTFTVKGDLGTNANGNVSVEITDMLGQVVATIAGKVENGKLDMPITLKNNVANGMYLVNIKSETSSVVFHFMIEK